MACGKVVLVVWVVAMLSLSTFLSLHWHEAVELMDDASAWMREERALGFAITAGMLFLASIPFVPGYSMFLMASGYVFGLHGFWPCVVGAQAGACFVFQATRSLGLEGSVRRLLANNKRMQGVLRAVSRGGIRTAWLIRTAPFSFSWSNLAFALTALPLGDFALATALSLPKVILHVWAGASVKRLGDLVAGPSGDDEEDGGLGAHAVQMLLGGALSVVVVIYVWRLASEELERAAESEDAPAVDAGVGVSVGVSGGGPAVPSPLSQVALKESAATLHPAVPRKLSRAGGIKH